MHADIAARRATESLPAPAADRAADAAAQLRVGDGLPEVGDGKRDGCRGGVLRSSRLHLVRVIG